MLPADLPLPYAARYCENLRPTSSNDVEEITWNVAKAVTDIIRGYKISLECYSQIREITTGDADGNNDFVYSTSKWREDLAYFYNGHPCDLLLLLFLASCWIFARWLSVNYIFQGFAIRLGVLPENAQRFRECVWRLTSGFSLWCLLVYVGFIRHDVFFNSMRLFSDWNSRDYPFDIKLVYFVEGSYFVFAAYLTAFVEEGRHDTLAMTIHHVITLSLMIVSYMVGYIKIGVLILVLNDISDILLDFTKISHYLKNTKFGHSKLFEAFSTIGVVLFSVSWFICRILLQLTKVMRSTALGSLAYTPFLPVPFYFYFNVLLIGLYALYVYWFGFIVRMVVDIMTGKRKLKTASDDTRNFKNSKKSN